MVLSTSHRFLIVDESSRFLDVFANVAGAPTVVLGALGAHGGVLKGAAGGAHILALSLRNCLLVSNSHPPNPSVIIDLSVFIYFYIEGSELASWASIPDNRGSPDITLRWCLRPSNTCIPGARANICDRLDWSLGTRSRHTCLYLTIRMPVHGSLNQSPFSYCR